VVVLAAWWLQLEKPEHLRGTVSPSSDGKTYLAIDDDNGGACGDLIIDGAKANAVRTVTFDWRPSQGEGARV
jgi:hypothetical protein